MSFYNTLQERTSSGQQYLMSAPIISRCFTGTITLDDYAGFLLQAYHHVKQTVPLLMGVGARLPESKEWLREAVAEYIAEETGHQEWVLNDIAQCGFDKEAARRSQPHRSTELMVAYAWDMVSRVNPLGFFGMVHVLEGTSINIASQAADVISAKLNLPQQAFSYLYSHGALDQDHIKFFASLMNKITDPVEQELIVHSATMFYQLYGNIFRGLDAGHGLPTLAVNKDLRHAS